MQLINQNAQFDRKGFSYDLNTEVLHFPEIQLGDEGLSELARNLVANPWVKEIKVDNDNIHDEGLDALAKTLQITDNIISLNLVYNELKLEANGFAFYLAQTRKLEYLNISHNDYIDDNGIKNLCNALKQNQSLRELHLQGNRISLQGLTYLKEAIFVNKNIEHINISLFNLGIIAGIIIEEISQNRPTITLTIEVL